MPEDVQCGSVFASCISMNSMTVTTHPQATQSILDNMHTAVMVIDHEMKIMHINPSAEMLFHISDSRAQDQHINQLATDEYEFYDRLYRSLRSQHPFSMFDTELLIHTGEIINIDYVATPLYVTADETYLLLEFQTLSRHRKIAYEQALLNQQDASRSLLRGLAHEIKNPLGGLRGAAQLLERQLDTDEDREFTRIIIHEADRLQNLVDRMLGPRTVPNKVMLNIHQVLEHIRQLVHAETPWVKFSADYDPSLPDICADESMMIQAVLNLTRNAVSAIDEEEGRIIFKTRTVRNQAIGNKTWPLVARIDVIDNGDGIPDDIIETIFLPMVTGRADGTGLGLSIAQSVINQHGGLIECNSEPGETAFTILFPLEINDA